MEFKIGDKVKMNRKTKQFKKMENDVSLAWWLVLEHNEPITIIDIEESSSGMLILTTDHNDLQVADRWVLPYEEDD